IRRGFGMRLCSSCRRNPTPVVAARSATRSAVAGSTQYKPWFALDAMPATAMTASAAPVADNQLSAHNAPLLTRRAIARFHTVSTVKATIDTAVITTPTRELRAAPRDQPARALFDRE